MEYERLTKRTDEYGIIIRCDNCKTEKCCFDTEFGETAECIEQAYDRLAELEDKIENGFLIELPCKVGDNFYEVDELIEEYCEWECCGFSVVDGRTEVINEVDSRYYADEVFFSKEEAEARIAELRGE